MALSIEDAAAFLPKYLSPSQRAELFSELSRLPETHSYFAANPDQPLLQGDGWEKVEFFDVETENLLRLRAVILSNTCDIDPANERAVPIRLMVSPLVRVSKFADLLRSHRIAESEINARLETIRRQEVSNIFYVPEFGSNEECMIFLDNVQSQVPGRFRDNSQKNRLFSLSQAGFWYFLLKLSIHFCRANEGVVRGGVSARVES